MIAEVETTGSDKNLTVAGDSKQESNIESTEPARDKDLPEGAKNWQHALQLSREREQAKEAELAEIRSKLEEAKAAERRKALEQLPELEQLRATANEEMQKRGKLEMRQLIIEATSDKSVPRAVRDLLLNSPWAIPAVSEELGATYTWDEAITSVKRHLPAYIASIAASEDTSSTSTEETVKKVDTERSAGTGGVVRNHIYTQAEVDSMDDATYEKHRTGILAQMGKNRGHLE